MELQHSVTESTNLPPFLGAAGDHGLSVSAEDTHEQSSDLRQLAALRSKTGQLTGGRFANPERRAEQAFPEGGFSARQAENDYAHASDD
jgi:hypothetical protein